MLVNLNDVLIPAAKGSYGVGFFNALNLEMARGVIGAAEELRAPVIVGTAEILLPYAPLENVADILLPMARRADVPVVLHYDHGLTFEKCMEALKLGFSSVMYDCSTENYDENLRKVAELTRIAHAFGATVEAELGHVGDVEGSGKQQDPSDFYTNPDQAEDYVRKTGVDALAIAVGTAHGAYKLPPKLDFERIQTIAERVSASLVLHGGSGLSDKDFQEAIRRGISKINIFTDINIAGMQAARRAIKDGASGMTDMMVAQAAAIREETKKKILLFGSAGKI